MPSTPNGPAPLPPKWNTAETATDPRVGFLLALGRALHGAGHSSQGLEELLELTAAKLGVPGEFFTTPTSIFAAFGHDERQRTYLLRVEPEGPDLGRLAGIKTVLDQVLDGTVDPATGAARLRAVAESRSPYSRVLTTAAFSLSSGASAAFFGGGPREIVLAAALGLVTGLLALVAERHPTLERIFATVAAFVVALLATVAGILLGNVSVSTAILGGLVVLLPGLMLVGAMGELASGHLSSGTARAAGAFIVFLGIGFGTALGTRVATGLELGATPVTQPEGLPVHYIWVAIVAAALAFAVLLKADRRDIPWIVLGACVSILASRLGSLVVGPEMAPFFGSFGVAVAGWLFATRTSRPSSVVVAPGVLVLVPGSIGFRSIAALMDRSVVAGIDNAMSALVTAIALVVGLLVANVVLPSRPDL
ncbi:MAG TPA: threonine/serine exporter family protein [Gemmatimonadales bacterium]|nr:threonine/serine exporter family protein [Gemmatimonadales bacterium]